MKTWYRIFLVVSIIVLSTACYKRREANPCDGDNIRRAQTYDRCTIERKCTLSGSEYTWLQDMKKYWPKCFNVDKLENN